MPDIAEELLLLLDGEDGRTVAQMIAEDPCSEYVVEKAVQSASGDGVEVTFGGGTCMFLRGRSVKAGDTIGLYHGGGSALGAQRHGWALNGEVVEWMTPLERIADRVKWLADHDRRRRERFAEEAPGLDADYEALPDPLKARIDRFRRESPAFRITGERYELFCCTEAAKFAQTARDAIDTGADADAVDAFWAMPIGRDEGMREPGTHFAEEPDEPAVRWLLWAWALNSRTYRYDHERQDAVLGSSDQHSGNTFNGACSLAVHLLRGAPEKGGGPMDH